MEINDKNPIKNQSDLIGNIIVGIICLLVMIGAFTLIYLKVNGPDYRTRIDIVYENGKKETVYYKDQLDINLHNGDLAIESPRQVIRSYVQSFTKTHIELPKEK